jgi:phosphoribosylformimino-5-aminoimidazole carboxamide ribotide isomerase
MIAIPVLELRGGHALVGGHDGAARAISPAPPAATVREWASVDLRVVQVTDLDASAGIGSNRDAIDEIIHDGAAEIQVAGGVRSADDIERLVDLGAVRVVVGARAVEEPAWLAAMSDLFPGTIVVAVEVDGRRIVARGWTGRLPPDVTDFVEDINDLALAGVIVKLALGTGAWDSSALALAEDLSEACPWPLFAAGAVSSIDTLRALEHRGVAGALLAEWRDADELRAIAREFAG